MSPLIINIDGYHLSDEEQSLLKDDVIGCVILFSHNYNNQDQIKELISQIKDINHKLLISVDHEGGRIQRFRQGFTTLPSFEKIANTSRKNIDLAQELSYACGLVGGYELSNIGVDINFSPVIDINRQINKKDDYLLKDRCFGDSANLIIKLAQSYIQGSLDAGILPVLKHFPGHGTVIEDSHVEKCVSPCTLSDIKKNDILPFLQLHKLFEIPIMTSHISFMNIDQEIVTYSSKWLNEISTDLFKSKPFFISDEIEMQSAINSNSKKHTPSERIIKAIKAGCNMVIATTVLNDEIINNKQSFNYILENFLTKEVIDCIGDTKNNTINKNISTLLPIKGEISPDYYQKQVRLIKNEYI